MAAERDDGALGFGDFQKRHSAANNVTSFNGVLQTLLGGEIEPLISFHVVFGNAVPRVVENPQGVLRFGNVLVGGFLIPVGGFARIDRDAFAMMIEPAEIVLCDVAAAIGGGAEPAGRALQILNQSVAAIVH